MAKSPYSYMAVTSDELELPVAIGDTIPELARQLRMTIPSVKSALYKNRSGQKKGIRIVAVLIPEDDFAA